MRENVRTALCKLALQMFPFICKLTGCYRDRHNLSDRPNLGTIEAVSAPRSIAVDHCQVRVDGRARIWMRFEANQLGMIDVSPRLATKNRPGQQGLAPQGEQALPIKIPWMN